MTDKNLLVTEKDGVAESLIDPDDSHHALAREVGTVMRFSKEFETGALLAHGTEKQFPSIAFHSYL